MYKLNSVLVVKLVALKALVVFKHMVDNQQVITRAMQLSASRAAGFVPLGGPPTKASCWYIFLRHGISIPLSLA